MKLGISLYLVNIDYNKQNFCWITFIRFKMAVIKLHFIGFPLES